MQLASILVPRFVKWKNCVAFLLECARGRNHIAKQRNWGCFRVFCNEIGVFAADFSSQSLIAWVYSRNYLGRKAIKNRRNRQRQVYVLKTGS